MASSAWLTAAVAVADAATLALGLQEDVAHEVAFPSDSQGAVAFDFPITRSAMVQRKEGVLATPNGEEIKFRALVSFLRPVAVGPKDRIVLRDGMTGPLHTPHGGMVDPATGAPFLRLVYIR